MRKAVIEDWDQFCAFLASQALCQWSAQKQREVMMDMQLSGSVPAAARPQKNDNADLVAALSSMA